MSKTRQSNLNGTEILRLKKLGLENCTKCDKKLNINDNVTFVKPFVNKGYSKPYHTKCWESMQY